MMAPNEYIKKEDITERGTATNSKVRIIAVLVAIVILVLVVTVAVALAVHQSLMNQTFSPLHANSSPVSANTKLPSGTNFSTGNEAGRETLLYVATWGDGIMTFSPSTYKLNTAIRTGEQVIGVAYDTTANFVYWTCFDSSSYGSRLYRSRESNDHETEDMLSTNQYGILRGMDFDWTTGNIYLVSSGGYILACDGDGHRNPAFSCAAVLAGQGDLRGIALHPAQRIMYWTKNGGSIVRAGMDGTNIAIIVSGLTRPAGVTIDFHSSKLYWADWVSNKIQSSNLDGSGVATVVQLSSGPYGVAVAQGRLYWSLYNGKMLQSRTTVGGEIRTLHAGRAALNHLTVPVWTTAPKNRTNPCGEQSCSGVCVLGPTSYKCFN